MHIISYRTITVYRLIDLSTYRTNDMHDVLAHEPGHEHEHEQDTWSSTAHMHVATHGKCIGKCMSDAGQLPIRKRQSRQDGLCGKTTSLTRGLLINCSGNLGRRMGYKTNRLYRSRKARTILLRFVHLLNKEPGTVCLPAAGRPPSVVWAENRAWWPSCKSHRRCMCIQYILRFEEGHFRLSPFDRDK